MIESIAWAAWSFSLLAVGVWLIVEWRRRNGVRRWVGLWVSLRIHRFRDWLGELEERVDDELVRS